MIEFDENLHKDMKMEETLKEAEGILFAREVAEKIRESGMSEIGQQESLERGKGIIQESFNRELSEASEYFNELMNDPEKFDVIKREMREKAKWTDSEMEAMLTVVRHGLHCLFSSPVVSPEEKKEGVSGGANLVGIFYEVINHDYGAEIAKKVTPLMNWYVEEARKFFSEKQKEGLGGKEDSESGELV